MIATNPAFPDRSIRPISGIGQTALKFYSGSDRSLLLVPLCVPTGHVDQPTRTKGVEDHLKMLFSNLLSNAVLYSYKGGRVGVQCSREDPSRAVVAISDEGIGIAAKKLPRIFDEHYRTNEAVRHNKESSGLGLAIVKHVTELHGIRLQVQTQPGAGTTFKLWFPCAAAEPPVSGKKEIRNGLCDDC